ncbi:hypothetical protein [Sulfitobacter sp. R18_1]|uniref:hypothetical protein n=1 Tax=Sulfitobacter sp. R18_1 TaxID=2821104 RepID=UPI001AD9E2A3|nr:hypothetical protein [Sulfitobacter sp. R18_1]MBO9428288.1 hypothetical protein [Sulfitobacter sp. R18_1]
MGKRNEIGAHVKIAFDNLCSVKALGFEDRNSCMILFYAAENLLMATFKAEDIPNSQWRGSAQHQLDRMVDLLPDECYLKEKFRILDPLTAYATTYRYPTVSGKAMKPMTAEETKRMATTLAGLVSKYCKHFGVDLKQESPKSLHAKPMREPSFEQAPEPAAPSA